MKALVAYFSYDDSEERVGNTRLMANIIAQSLINKSDLVRVVKIDPVEPYPTDYDELCKYAKYEYDNSIEREFKSLKLDNDYDAIYIGFPIWYRSYPRIISKFLKSLNLEGNYVIPFCTNEEGSFGMADMELNRLISSLGGHILTGLSCRGPEVDSNKEKIKEFVKNTKIKLV